MKYLRESILLRLAALGTLLAISGALTFGYLGWLHPAFDSFSHFRVHLAAGLFVAGIPLLLLFRYWPEAIFAALFSVTTMAQTVGIPLPSQISPVNASATPHAGAVYRLLHMNLRYDNPTPEAVFSLIGREKPDIITMNEVSAYWVEKLAILKAAYPYQLICPPPAYIGGTAIVSRRPFAEGFAPECGDRGSFGHVSLDMNGRTLDVASLHLGWPWPFEQPWQLPHVEPLLGAIDGTAIIAGDLNAVPWSQTAKRVSAASGAELLRGIGPTYLDRRFPAWMRPLIGLPIDNMMAKGGIVPIGLTRMEAVGSDHLPILFEFMLMPQEQPASVQHADASADWR